MDTVQLIQCLWENTYTRRQFGDVLAVDALPLNSTVPPHKNIYIINTDVQSGPGKHWVLIYLPPKSPGEFFDSMGLDLNAYGPQLWDFMFLNKCSYVHNRYRLQSENSTTCGQYCLYYAVHRCRGLPPDDIINSFTQDHSHNDFIVTTFLNDYFDSII